jgi:hypothetical protein
VIKTTNELRGDRVGRRGDWKESNGKPGELQEANQISHLINEKQQMIWEKESGEKMR